MEKEIKFSDCTQEFLETEFGLRQTNSLFAMEYWTKKSYEMTVEKKEKTVLRCYQKLVPYNLRVWNEIEWMQYFVGPILGLVNFQTEYFNIYSWRRIEAVVQNWRIYGDPDAMIATGRFSPKLPYLCLNEYKRSEETKGDSIGQMLSEMLVSQTLNQNEKPVYGIFLIGAFWHFAVLENKKYCISDGYAGDSKALFDLFKMLKALKVIFLEMFTK